MSSDNSKITLVPSSYIGYTLEAAPSPVFFSPMYGLVNNLGPITSISGATGGGKTNFALRVIRNEMLKGIRSITAIDPKADLGPLVNFLEEFGEHQVEVWDSFSNPRGTIGALDPFRRYDGQTEEDLTSHVKNVVTILMGGGLDTDEKILLDSVIQDTARDPNPSLHRMIDMIEQNTPPESFDIKQRVLVKLREPQSGSVMSKLLYAPGSATKKPIRVGDGLYVINTFGLELPRTEAESMSTPTKRLATAIMFSITQMIMKVMENRILHPYPKMLVIDEASTVMATPQGRDVLDHAARRGRSFNLATMLMSQNSLDIGEVEGIGNAISTRFAFRSDDDNDAARTAELFGVPPETVTPLLRNTFRNRVGCCLMLDPLQRVGAIQTTHTSREAKRLFNSNPLKKVYKERSAMLTAGAA